jgi:membrane protein
VRLDLRSLARHSLEKWSDEPGPRFAAALAFYTVLAIVPLVVLAVMVSASFMGDEATRDNLPHHIADLIGEPAANGLFHLVEQWKSAGSPLVNQAVALGIFALGALRVMDQLQDALDCIWGLKPKRPQGMMSRVRQRFASLSGLLGLAFLLLASLILSAWLGIGLKWVLGAVAGPAALRQVLVFLISYVIVSASFSLIYKWVPQAQVAWSDVWVGAAITGALYMVGSKFLVVYLAHTALVAFYGGAGALVLLLLWAYYASQTFLFGAVVIAVYATHYGSLVRPSDGAVAVHPASEGDAIADQK